MLQQVIRCPDCNKIMNQIIFTYRQKFIPWGAYICPLHREVDIPEDLISYILKDSTITSDMIKNSHKLKKNKLDL